jgi:hypothetical protein
VDVCIQSARCGCVQGECMRLCKVHLAVGPGFNLRGTQDTQGVQGVVKFVYLATSYNLYTYLLLHIYYTVVMLS